MVLFASKDDAVVKYALRRSLSPALIADYKRHLPNKEYSKVNCVKSQNLLSQKKMKNKCGVFIGGCIFPHGLKKLCNTFTRLRVNRAFVSKVE